MSTSVPTFEADLADWLAGNIPCFVRTAGLFQDHEFLSWNHKATEANRKNLAALYSDYEILPSAVMNILSCSWMQSRNEQKLFHHQQLAWLRTSKTKTRILHQFEKLTAKLVPFAKIRVIPIEALEEIKKAIESYPPLDGQRLDEQFLNWCVSNLAAFFEAVTGSAQYKEIGILLRDSFPEIWKASGEEDAARKRSQRHPRPLMALLQGIGAKEPELYRWVDPVVSLSIMIQKDGAASVTREGALSRFLGYSKDPIKRLRKGG